MPMATETRTPLFTIVTSTYNAAGLLASTARSLDSQDFRSFEWLIIDGASSDGTVALAQGFGELVTLLVSEPDQGIYSAWNKALSHIRGEWVLFLGAGDLLLDAGVLGRIAALLPDVPPRATLAYGDVLYFLDDPEQPSRLRNETWAGLRGPWVGGRPVLPCHQGVFHRASLFREGFSFDPRLKISGDNEILLRELVQGRGHKLDLLVSRFHADGLSAQRDKRLRMIAESVYINWKLGIFWKRPFYQLYMLAGNSLRHALRSISSRVQAGR